MIHYIDCAAINVEGHKCNCTAYSEMEALRQTVHRANTERQERAIEAELLRIELDKWQDAMRDGVYHLADPCDRAKTFDIQQLSTRIQELCASHQNVTILATNLRCRMEKAERLLIACNVHLNGDDDETDASMQDRIRAHFDGNDDVILWVMA